MTNRPTAIVCVDGSVKAGKRRAWVASIADRSVTPLAGRRWTVPDIVQVASALTLQGWVLVGLDVVLGLPARFWPAGIPLGTEQQPPGFLAWLRSVNSADLRHTVTRQEDWSPQSPFFRVLPGAGTWTAWKNYLGEPRLYRRVDQPARAKPVFMTGLPGQVGPASREVWIELAPIIAPPDRRVSLWPFDGTLRQLAAHKRVVVAEIYPKACYGIALAPSLPAEPNSLKKGLCSVRAQTLARLKASEWFQRAGIRLEGETKILDSGDHFDAALSALALLRLTLQDLPLDGFTLDDPHWEGGILGIRHLRLRLPKG